MALAFAVSACFGVQPAYAAPPVETSTSRVLDRYSAASVAGGAALSARGGIVLNTTGAQTAAFQTRLNGALQNMLDAVLGPGRAVVTTNAELDFDQIDTVTTTYSQDPAVGALSERLSEKSYTANSGSTRYDSSSTARTNALNSLRETRRNAPGDITRLTVAVLIDATAAENLDLAQVEKLIAAAAGIDARRGDTVTVAAMPIHTSATPTDSTLTPPVTASATGRPSALVAAIPVLLVAILLLAGRRYRSLRTRRQVQRDQLERVRAELHQQRPAAAGATVAASATAAGLRSDRLQGREISRWAADSPQQAAAVLRDWTGSER
ncbi:flagellar M-ring protein FliF C-terminal domain-containing protein [Actinoplanes sp. NPDC049802]|uniref:flagellar M-ring protein FliF C-terminal domain-containing protein n=1 Tax=Actinoplanes sp. NPDC049802 TaxID=3154742 RepID=UPI0033CB8C74